MMAKKIIEVFIVILLLILSFLYLYRKLIIHEKEFNEYRFVCYVYSYSKDGEVKNVFLTNDDWAETSNLRDHEGALWQIERFPRYKCIEKDKDKKSNRKS